MVGLVDQLAGLYSFTISVGICTRYPGHPSLTRLLFRYCFETEYSLSHLVVIKDFLINFYHLCT